MMGEMDPQLNISDMDKWFDKISKKSFWHHLRVWSEQHVRKDDFAHLFSSTTGRNSMPPQLTFLAMWKFTKADLHQVCERISINKASCGSIAYAAC